MLKKLLLFFLLKNFKPFSNRSWLRVTFNSSVVGGMSTSPPLSKTPVRRGFLGSYKKSSKGPNSLQEFNSPAVVDHITSRQFLRACLRGKQTEAQALLVKHPSLDINHGNVAKETPLFFASAISVPLSRFLLKHGANPLLKAKGNRTVAHQLAILGDAQLWKDFCQNEAFRSLLKKNLKADGDGVHPLHLAAKLGHLQLMEVFPPRWDYDVRDLTGSTPLMYAIALGNYEVALHLLTKNLRLGHAGARFRSQEMGSQSKNTALHIMLVSEDIVPSDRLFKRVLKELARQKAPLGCIYCSDGKGCTSIARKRLLIYRKMKSTLRLNAKNGNLGGDISEEEMRAIFMSLVTTGDAGGKGGLWKGLMKCGSKEPNVFSQNLNWLFQELDFEEEATRAVLVNEVGVCRDPIALIREHTVFTNLLLTFMQNEGKSYLSYFAKVFCCECPKKIDSSLAMAQHFFTQIRSSIGFFPTNLRSLLLLLTQMIDEKFGGDFGGVFLKGNLFVRFISSICTPALAGCHSPSCSISPDLLKETQFLIKDIVSGQKANDQVSKHIKEFEFIYEQFLDPNFETSSSMLQICSHRIQKSPRSKEKDIDDEGEDGDGGKGAVFRSFFSQLLEEHKIFLEDAIMMRSKVVAKNEHQIQHQLEAYFKQ